MFRTKEQALEYLRKCGKIMIPSKFTYWCHSAQVQTDKEATQDPKFNKLWKEIPTDKFIVKNELSLLKRRQRLEAVAEHQSFDAAPISYAEVKGQEGFQIKVILPKQGLSKAEYKELGKDEDYINKLDFEDRGLGDGRHPKLSNKTQVYIFGQMDYDEMSKKPIKTVIGVREEDLLVYANEVQRELAEKAKEGIVADSEYTMPEFRGVVEDSKEFFVVGDNNYTKELLKDGKSSIKEDETETKNEEKQYDLEALKEKIEKEYGAWLESEDQLPDRYKTIEQTKVKRFSRMPAVGNISAVRAVDGKISVDKYNSASEQKRLLHSIQMRCEGLSKSIEGNINSKYGNYLQYATNDYCDLAVLDSILPKVQERAMDLEIYEKHIGQFITTKYEQTKVRKAGILGFFGAKEVNTSLKKLTSEEMMVKKQADIVKLNIALAEGDIDKNQYDKVCEVLDRLYGEEESKKTVEKVDKSELDKMLENNQTNQKEEEKKKQMEREKQMRGDRSRGLTINPKRENSDEDFFTIS